MLRRTLAARVLAPALQGKGLPFAPVAQVKTQALEDTEVASGAKQGKLLSVVACGSMLSLKGTSYPLFYYTVMTPNGTAVVYKSFKEYKDHKVGDFVTFSTQKNSFLLQSMQGWAASAEESNGFPAEPARTVGNKKPLHMVTGVVASANVYPLPLKLNIAGENSEAEAPEGYAHWYGVRAETGNEYTLFWSSQTQRKPLLQEGVRARFSFEMQGADCTLRMRGFDLLAMTATGTVTRNAKGWISLALDDDGEKVSFLAADTLGMQKGQRYTVSLVPMKKGPYYRAEKASPETPKKKASARKRK